MEQNNERSWLLRNDMIFLYTILCPLLGAGVVFFNRHQLTRSEKWSHGATIIIVSIIWSAKFLPNVWYYQVPIFLFILVVIGVRLFANEQSVKKEDK